tara:strand:- start:292 stop:450 length:159 start_codon:yes stop_codon:yes gene_type:complete
MPYGEGTYGKKRGRPTKKRKVSRSQKMRKSKASAVKSSLASLRKSKKKLVKR